MPNEMKKDNHSPEMSRKGLFAESTVQKKAIALFVLTFFATLGGLWIIDTVSIAVFSTKHSGILFPIVVSVIFAYGFYGWGKKNL
jgi:hypothetical protein